MPFDLASVPIPNEKPNWREVVRSLPMVWRVAYAADRKSAFQQLIVIVSEGPSNALFTLSLKWMTDALLARQFSTVWTDVAILSGVMAWQAVTTYLSERSSDEWRYRVQVAVERLQMDQVSRLPLSLLESSRFSTLYAALGAKMGNFPGLVQNTLWLARRLFGILGLATMFLLFPWQAAVLVLAFQVLLIFLYNQEADFSWNLLSMDAREGRRGRYYERAILGANFLFTTRALGLAKPFQREWLKTVDRVMKERLKSAHLFARSAFFAQLCSLGGFLAGIWFLAPKILTGELGIGVAVVFIAGYFRFSQGISSITDTISWFMKEAPCFVLFQQFLSLPREPETGMVLKKTSLKIEFQDVWFRYPETANDVLRGISFSFNEGDHLALIGLNGAGKSTLLKLLMRVYEPTKGKILINGIDLWRVKPSVWQEALGVLSQDIPRYDDILESQIRYGDFARPLDRRRLQTSLRVSGFGEIAEDFPKKLKTHVGKEYAMAEDQAIELSGGQNQILAIARTLYRSARIYIFDEPTSAVDAEKEEHFFEKLPDAMQGKSVIFVSHRFSTLRRAPRILVMDQGKIIEDGSHEQLLAKEGRYAELFALQARMYQ